MRELSPELRALRDLARAAAEGTYEVEDLLRRISTSVAENFGFERVTVTRYVAESRMLFPLVAHGIPDEMKPPPTPIETQPMLERALVAREAVFVADAREDPVFSPEIIELFDVRSVFAAPMFSGGDCIGFLAGDRGGTVFELDQGTLDVLTTIAAVTAAFLGHGLEHGELQRLDQLKTEFIALASHELRTPIAVVHGIAITLDQRGDDIPAEQRSQLRRTLVEQTDRLRRLIEQLLDLSRLDADAIEIKPEHFRVRRRLEELILTVAGGRVGEVRIEVPPDLETVADPHAFDRILSNLVTNAFKYGAPPVIVSAGQSDRHLRVTVEDRGRGVAPEFVPALFQRFTRSEPSTADAQGAGLGLSIARSYAEAHGGEIFYRPAEPHGARFELVLPVRR